ncbi:MAG: putative ATPase/class 3 adenylate cyclase [Verrucomicrobiales bacterium]|jgi:predicted ATPase/class 3 adenylate cyclase
MKILGRRTLLFTDIEGSTALLQRIGHPRFVELMDKHHQIMRTAIRNNDGKEIRNEGDAFVVLFPTPMNGLNCAVESQKAFRAGPWPPGAAISVRMGLHEGEIGLSESGHHGIALHEAARVSSAAHGGQVLLSEDAHNSMTAALPEGSPLRLVELGTFALKDIGKSVPLIQVVHPDLVDDFPMPRSSGSTPHNLPAQLTCLVGRTDEALEVEELIRSHRLVTLLGAGGVGKTRLALQVAADLGSHFSDGMWLVELASHEDPSQIFDEIRRSMRIPDDGNGDQTTIHAIHTSSVLLILDNCEHLLEGVARSIDILIRECPGLHVLTTSREPVGTMGEVQWRVPPLTDSDAVDLLTARARLVAPNFEVSLAERDILERVCQRLDGIPLAIELVAGRLATIPVEEIESRLLDELRLLSTGARGHLPRHKTLRAALDWSYRLLSSEEQRLLKCLAVFPGSFELPAAEAICSDEVIAEHDILDLLESLHAKSLVTVDWSRKPPLVSRSEIVGQYAASLLSTTDEGPRLAQRHARYYFELSNSALPGFRGSDRYTWMTRVDADRDNLSQAFEWLAEHDPDDAASMIVNLKEWLIAAVSSPWRTRLRQLSERTDISPRSIAVSNAIRSMLAGVYGFETAAIASETSRRALDHLDAIDDQRDRIRALTNLAAGSRETDQAKATWLTEQAVSEAEELGEEKDIVASMLDLLIVHHEHHHVTRRLRSAVLERMEDSGAWPSVHPLVDSALAAHQEGEHERSLAWLTQAEQLLPPVPMAGGIMTEDAQVWTIWSVLIRAEVGDTATAILLAESAFAAFGDKGSLATKTLTSNYGQALLIDGRFDEAYSAFEVAIELEDAWRYVSFAIASLGLASIDIRRDNCQAAVDRLTPISIENPRIWVQARAHDVLAQAHFGLDQRDDVKRHVRLADELRQEYGFAVPRALRAEADAIRNTI